METTSPATVAAPAPPIGRPWRWVPSLYFAEGLPYVMANTVSVVVYKGLGVSNAEIALWTSWLYLPWVIKPLWSPVVDVLRTKRWWTVGMQLAMAAALIGVALLLPREHFLPPTLALFGLLAFSSATHDIAADGFYMLGLDQAQQAAFVGVRATFYRVAMVTGEGGLVVLAGLLATHAGLSTARAWSLTFVAAAALMAAACAWHAFALPRPAADVAVLGVTPGEALRRFVDVFATFFKKKDIVRILLFLLLYRFAEAQLVKLISPFLLDSRARGGLGLSNEQLGVVKGTVGVVALLAGGLLGGLLISRGGLKRWLWVMVCAIHLPDAVFVFLSQAQPQSLLLISGAVALEQFGYGFGFAAYSLYMIMVSDGPYKTAHFALCTAFMALGMMLPGMFSGAVQEWLGYQRFFLWVLASTVPGFLVVLLVRVDPEFGKKVA